MTTTRSIAVIGAGFSGTLLAVQLLRRAGPADRIYLFGRLGAHRQELAYSTEDSLHLLNVRVSNMSAIPRRAKSFLDWLRVNGARHGLSGGAVFFRSSQGIRRLCRQPLARDFV